MPRPTVAQLAYGSATVICSTIAMLLLSRTSAGPGVGVIAVSALILGVFVALSVPRPKADPPARPETARTGQVPAQRLASTLSSPAVSGASESVREPAHGPAGP
ncbi:hypothetical protein GTW43_22550 [Streptomyces sp. SID5785]|uniref:hypothetical protein n=1 Tax=Streptomyces sp. SID5785 TaxID=2690309 RepID=UPI0013611D33|nr:hypothetical protein [Streptomyces sp. SID5785]MZD07841.1 hypothetical protein [Streptomyces sp. SID5785]